MKEDWVGHEYILYIDKDLAHIIVPHLLLFSENSSRELSYYFDVIKYHEFHPGCVLCCLLHHWLEEEKRLRWTLNSPCTNMAVCRDQAMTALRCCTTHTHGRAALKRWRWSQIQNRVTQHWLALDVCENFLHLERCGLLPPLVSLSTQLCTMEMTEGQLSIFQ